MTGFRSTEIGVLRVASTALLTGAAVYVAARFSGRTALVNVGYWLPMAALAGVVLAGGARDLAQVFRSRLALAAFVYFLVAAASLSIAPDRSLAVREFLPAHGTALVSAVFVAGAAARGRDARWFVVAVVVGSVLASANQIGEHWAHWRATGTPFPDYQEIRRNGPAHAFFLPAVIALFFFAKRTDEKVLLAVIAACEAILLLFAGPRGPWLSVVVASAVSAALTRQWRALGILVALVVSAVFVISVSLPNSVVRARLDEGLSTSGRITGTWGPALALIAERPWRGYGYGNGSFARAFDRAAPRHPEWTEKKSLGPHNIYLGAWAAGGPVLLAAMLWLFAEIALALRRAYLDARSDDLRALALATLASFVSAYLVYGMLEDMQVLGLGVLLGLALGVHRAVVDEAASLSASKVTASAEGGEGRAWSRACERVALAAASVAGPKAKRMLSIASRMSGNVAPSFSPAPAPRGERERKNTWRSFGHPALRFVVFLVGACATLYTFGRYSHKGGLVNTSFYLGLLAVGLYAGMTRGRALTRLLESRLALAAVVLLVLLTYSIQIAPEPANAVYAFTKSHGHVFLLAALIGCAAAEERFRPWLLAALVAGALPEVVRQLDYHWTQWRESGRWLIQYELVREFGNAYAFYLPACVAALVCLRRRVWISITAVIAVVQALLFLFTAFRGAWLGAVTGVLAVAMVSRSWRVVLGLGAIALAGVAALTLTMPSNVVSERLAKGFDSSARTDLNWSPALELIKERPLRGYGYGNDVIDAAYERAREKHPEWVVPEWMRKSDWSPHSIYLAMWLRGGLLALVALLWLFVEMMLVFAATARRGARPADRALGLAGLGVLVSAYVVHGLFEEKFWAPFGIPLGLALGLAATKATEVTAERERFAPAPNGG